MKLWHAVQASVGVWFVLAGYGFGQTAWVPGGEAWENPPLADRPLQIVHGIDPSRVLTEGIDQMVHQPSAPKSAAYGMRYYVDRGLGGIVTNVAFSNYMRSEEQWKVLSGAVEACQRLGMVVWLYDEEGYPSGAAGGLVLAENAALEAMALAFDASREDPFLYRPAYEHTHASNNYYAARRYVNLMDDRATAIFLTKTHEAYWARLSPHFGHTIQAMFTDEPSLIAVNLGQIPEPARSRVRVVDPVDPQVKPLPSVPWCYDLPDRYRQRYGEDLIPARRSLFAGQSAEDRRVRRQFWALVADLVAERFFAALGRWCAEHGVASSGHNLAEESILHHVPLYGNGLKALGLMHIPGLDMLSSDPEVVVHGGWMTAAMPLSAAMLNGRRRVMTEVSDFSQRQSGAGPVGLAEMQATAAWQAAWGVTDFTLYYSMADRSAEVYRAYGDYVGRLNVVLKAAEPQRDVLLYYPIYDLWAEYVPVAEPLRLESQSTEAQRIVRSFFRLGQTLQRHQVPFLLVDHEHLASAQATGDGLLEIYGRRFRVLVVPDGVQLPQAAAAVVDAWTRQGGRVLRPGGPDFDTQRLLESLPSPYGLVPPSDRIVLGVFSREGRTILLVVNVSPEPYEGHLTGLVEGDWQAMDPTDASIRPAKAGDSVGLRLALRPRQAILLVLVGSR